MTPPRLMSPSRVVVEGERPWRWVGGGGAAEGGAGFDVV
jgi:hypothetical protein